LADGELDQDPRKRKLKLDVMALGKADRERLKALVKVSLKFLKLTNLSIYKINVYIVGG
jgi:hypothetical protein